MSRGSVTSSIPNAAAVRSGEVMACKWCSDRTGITAALEKAGVKVLYVGPVISRLIKDGWAPLTF